LTVLSLSRNRISKPGPLASLTNLTVLGLDFNVIRNLRPLAALTFLTSLSLRYNDIHDLHPLVTNAGLCCGDSVDLVDNPLDAPEAQADIQTLINRGINVYY
jgi:internalin A